MRGSSNRAWASTCRSKQPPGVSMQLESSPPVCQETRTVSRSQSARCTPSGSQPIAVRACAAAGQAGQWVGSTRRLRQGSPHRLCTHPGSLKQRDVARWRARTERVGHHRAVRQNAHAQQVAEAASAAAVEGDSGGNGSGGCAQQRGHNDREPHGVKAAGQAGRRGSARVATGLAKCKTNSRLAPEGSCLRPGQAMRRKLHRPHGSAASTAFWDLLASWRRGQVSVAPRARVSTVHLVARYKAGAWGMGCRPGTCTSADVGAASV